MTTNDVAAPENRDDDITTYQDGLGSRAFSLKLSSIVGRFLKTDFVGLE
jgi:hypothetical protein